MIATEPARGSPAELSPHERTRWLFRRAARAGQVHPLQRLIGLYREHEPDSLFGELDIGSGPPAHGVVAARPLVANAALATISGPGAWRICPEGLARRVGQLPVLPQAVLQALALLRSDTASDIDCAERIAIDAAMAARTLRLANSAFYGVSGRVATIRDAVVLLGRRTIGTLLATAAVADTLARSDIAGGADRQAAAQAMGRFWRHALGSALAAQALASRRPPDQDVAFTTGLLHDIGQLVLGAHHASALQAVRAAAREDDADTLPIERALLGLDHAEVGAMVARHWRFPAEVVEAIGSHHAGTPGTPAEGPVTLGDLVHVADAIAHALDLAGEPDEAVPALDSAAWRRVALGADEALNLLRDVENGVRVLSRSLLG
ncbi:MAG: hypothetical protein RLZZ524_863 [Pseudomonadota bacterium]